MYADVLLLQLLEIICQALPCFTPVKFFLMNVIVASTAKSVFIV